MSFGRRSEPSEAAEAGEERASGLTDLLRSHPWLPVATIGGLAAMIAGAAAFAVMQPREVDAQAVLERAAVAGGLTEQRRMALREKLSRTMREMQENLCDESSRDDAGKAAVAYYEQILEKPVIAAGLEATYHNRCQRRFNQSNHPFEQLIQAITARGLGSNLQLPWDCLPDSWRTPADRALQAKLEEFLRTGYLTSESLSGTLALIARSKKSSPLPRLCYRPPPSTRATNLPLISEPTDDWDRQGRRRRRY